MTVLVALTVIGAARNFLPPLLAEHRFEEDASQHVWWTWRFRDPDLFPNDLAATYFSRPVFAPWGYQALYRVFVPFVDPQTFSELLPFALAAAMGLLAFLSGRSAAGGAFAGGIVCGALAAIGDPLKCVEDGLPRSFAVPIVFLGVWAMLERRMGWLGVAFTLAALFFPPVFVNLGLFAGVALLLDATRGRGLPPRFARAIAGGAIAVVLIVAAYATPLPDGLGPRTSFAEARSMPELGPNGRLSFFSDDPVTYWLTGSQSGLRIRPLTLVAVLAGATGILAFSRRLIRAELWVLALSGLAAFAIAHATLFALYLPSRYSRYVTVVLTPIVAGVLASRLLTWIAATGRGARILTSATRPAVASAAAGVILLAAGIPAFEHVERKIGENPAEGYLDAIRFLETLPKHTLIAAHPEDANAIPLLAKRSVIASEETSLPWHRGYYERMSARIRDELLACYASDWVDVDRLFERYGVRVFLANERRFRYLDRRVYVAPFDEAVRPSVERGRTDGFVLAHPPPERVLFRRGAFSVIRVGSPM